MMLKLAANISGDKLVSLGTCFGKFTKTHKFRLHVTALDYLAPYAKVRGGGHGQFAIRDEVPGDGGQVRPQVLYHRVSGQGQRKERFVCLLVVLLV